MLIIKIRKCKNLTTYQILAIIGIFFLILILIVFSSRTRIIKTYDKYMKIGNKSNITGKELAFRAKQQLELHDLEFALLEDKLSDAYSPKHKTLILSREVCDTASLAALTIVAHELGHAMQHKNDSGLFFLNQLFGKLTRFTNRFIIPLLVIGLASFVFKYPNPDIGITLMLISGILFAMHILFLICTIPLEYNASSRALRFLKNYNYVSASELKKAKKLLSIAAQTYIVGLFDGLFVFNKKRTKK